MSPRKYTLEEIIATLALLELSEVTHRDYQSIKAAPLQKRLGYGGLKKGTPVCIILPVASKKIRLPLLQDHPGTKTFIDDLKYKDLKLYIGEHLSSKPTDDVDAVDEELIRAAHIYQLYQINCKNGLVL